MNEIVEKGLWTAHSIVQYFSFVVNTACCNCEGKDHKASDCSSKKATNSNPNQNQTKLEENV